MSGIITFEDLVFVQLRAARRIEITQAELIACGIRTEPDGGQMQEKAEFEAAARLIRVVAGDSVIRARLKVVGLKTQQATTITNRGLGSDSAGVPDDDG